jgi:hypothetical protein
MAEVEATFVAQTNCTEELVAPLACTLEIVKLDGVGVGVGVGVAPLGLTTPAHPAKPKLNIVMLRTAAKSRNPRLLAERAAISIFHSPRKHKP